MDIAAEALVGEAGVAGTVVAKAVLEGPCS